MKQATAEIQTARGELAEAERSLQVGGKHHPPVWWLVVVVVMGRAGELSEAGRSGAQPAGGGRGVPACLSWAALSYEGCRLVPAMFVEPHPPTNH